MIKTTVTDAATGERTEIRKVPPPKLVLFHNHERGQPYGGLFREDKNAFVPDFALAPMPSQTTINWLCKQHGSAALKVADLPSGVFKFEPGDSKVAVRDARGNWTVNTWVEPATRSQALPCTECPPTIRALLLHVMGDDEVSLNRFLNWTAVAYQTNRPTGTAWIWSGIQGTGKSRVIAEVMKPVFGEEYCFEKRTSELADQFNAWLERGVILNIDEADLRAAAKSDLESKVKMYITGETLSIRGMQQITREVPNFLNIILTSNKAVAADLPEGDRRFSVSPRQMAKIEAKFPDTNEMVKQIRAEIRHFAGFMKQYPADIQLARTAMASAAKAEMIKAAASGPNEFAEALREGDLQYFVDSYFDLPERSVRPGELALKEDFRAAVANWVERSSLNLETPIRTNMLCDMYNLIFRQRDEMTPERLGKFLRKHGLYPMQMNTRQMRGRGLLVKWNAPADAVPTSEALLAKASGPQRLAEREFANDIPEPHWLDTMPTHPERSLNS